MHQLKLSKFSTPIAFKSMYVHVSLKEIWIRSSNQLLSNEESPHNFLSSLVHIEVGQL